MDLGSKNLEGDFSSSLSSTFDCTAATMYSESKPNIFLDSGLEGRKDLLLNVPRGKKNQVCVVGFDWVK
jgi:hypothetical protein